MPTTRVFRMGNRYAVRIPKEFHFKGDTVEVYRRGNEIILREKDDRPSSKASAQVERQKRKGPTKRSNAKPKA
jgi:virulence-associated protein VagC